MIYLLGYPRQLSYDYDWIQAFTDHYDGTRLVRLDGDKPQDIDSARLIVLLHSATAQGVKFPPWLYQLKRRCPLVMLTGNDYKFFPEKQKAADALHVDVLGAIVPNPPYMTGKGLRKVVHLPHAMNPKAFYPEYGHDQRRWLVGYRGIKYPPNLGDTERNDLVEAFMPLPNTDIRWGVFDHPAQYSAWLRTCKATVATEAGLKGMKAISSRQFDAIGSGTALIMYPGDYSGCIDERHFIRLKKDHSNIGECLARVDDPVEWEKVVARAIDHVRRYHLYTHRMAELDTHLWQ